MHRLYVDQGSEKTTGTEGEAISGNWLAEKKRQ